MNDQIVIVIKLWPMCLGLKYETILHGVTCGWVSSYIQISKLHMGFYFIDVGRTEETVTSTQCPIPSLLDEFIFLLLWISYVNFVRPCHVPRKGDTVSWILYPEHYISHVLVSWPHKESHQFAWQSSLYEFYTYKCYPSMKVWMLHLWVVTLYEC